LDITVEESIRSTFEKFGSVDAVVSASGSVKFAPFGEMSHDDYTLGLEDKLMGQVDLVLIGRDYVSEGGSFTLTSGVLDSDPIVAGTSASMVNGALNSFVRAAAIEMPRGQRINVVSPGVIEESMDAYAPFFRGFEPVPAARAALAYAKSVEGAQTGQVYRVV
jgi:NAD(P)-dependent dehydrogenase (short-subunit alcohol dehydrogenase family)